MTRYSYLFVIAMEAFSYIPNREKEGGFIVRFSVRRRGGEFIEVLDLLFVDDTLILCDTDKKHMEYLNWTFMWFEVISS